MSVELASLAMQRSGSLLLLQPELQVIEYLIEHVASITTLITNAKEALQMDVVLCLYSEVEERYYAITTRTDAALEVWSCVRQAMLFCDDTLQQCKSLVEYNARNSDYALDELVVYHDQAQYMASAPIIHKARGVGAFCAVHSLPTGHNTVSILERLQVAATELESLLS